MRTAIVPGSFDPITLGHADIVRRAAALFDRVIAVAMVNADKQYLFTLAERRTLMEQTLNGIPNVLVDSHGGMLYEYARDNGVCAIVKGVRSVEDMDYELRMAIINKEYYAGADTILLPAGRGMETISSTEVKRLCAAGRDISRLVVPVVEKALRTRLAEEN